MNQTDIDKAFEGRWRIKGNFGQINQNRATMNYDDFYQYIKSLCRDFFKVGMLIGEGFNVAEDQCGTVIYKHDPVIDTADNGFSTWWKLYDKMVGRKDCEKKWAKLSFAEKDACIRATPAYVASTPDKQFRKNPLSYLNQKAWNDEIIIKNNGTNKPTADQQRLDRLADILAE